MEALMKKITLISMILAGLIIIAGVSCRGKDEKGDTQAFAAARVKVVELRPMRISENLVYTGTVEAWQEISITPEIAGKIAAIHVEEGQRVRAGQLLAELDTESTRLQLRQAEAGLAAAEANYQDALKNKERMDRLIKENAVSQSQYERVQLAFDAAAAQREQAEAAVALASHTLDVSLMKAPFSGIIASKNAKVGDVMNPMMGSFSPTSGVLKLVDDSRVKVAVGVTQDDVLRIEKGQEAVLRTDAYPGRDFKGRVSVVNISADPANKKFRVEAVFGNPGLELRPGTFARISLEVQTNPNALAVPQMALVDGRFVFVAEGAKAVRKEVTLGIQNSDHVEIKSGLKPGDLVIVEGNLGLEDGSSIEIK